MGMVEAVRAIKAPVESVWNCLSDIEHTPEWVIGLKSVKVTSDSPRGVGTSYHDYNQIGPFVQASSWSITSFDPMTKQIHESTSSLLPTTITFNLMPMADGTFVHMVVDYRFWPRLGIASRVFERLVMNHLLGLILRKNLGNLEDFIRC